MTTAAPEAAQALSAEELELIEQYWRAANYLSVGQIYLLDNPLLEEPLTLEHIKPRLLGHWGTTPGLNFIYVHLNRVIKAHDLDMIYICGPGHGGPGDGREHLSRGHVQRALSRTSREDDEGMQKLFKQFSFPGRHPEPRRARDARLDPRGRRARLLALARLRRGVRQSGSDRRLRRRRRRGRDGAARDGVALEQVPESRHRRRRPARSCI